MNKGRGENRLHWNVEERGKIEIEIVFGKGDKKS